VRNRRQVIKTLYQLKRDFGNPIVIRNPLFAETNRATGVVKVEYVSVPIRRAVILPAKRIPDYVYDLSFIAANKNFTYGGFFSASTVPVILDGKDIPKDFEITENTELIVPKDALSCQGGIYAIKQIVPLVNGLGYFIMATHLETLNES